MEHAPKTSFALTHDVLRMEGLARYLLLIPAVVIDLARVMAKKKQEPQAAAKK